MERANSFEYFDFITVNEYHVTLEPNAGREHYLYKAQRLA